VLFVGISEVEIKVCHQGLTDIAHGFYVFDDCRTGEQQGLNCLSQKQ
jgi:hypothetical protein